MKLLEALNVQIWDLMSRDNQPIKVALTGGKRVDFAMSEQLLCRCKEYATKTGQSFSSVVRTLVMECENAQMYSARALPGNASPDSGAVS